VEILLVDDNEDDIVIIQEAFAEMTRTIIISTVRDGEEALRYLRREGKFSSAQIPDAVLLDINMPRKSGFEVLEELKRESTLSSLPVIMLTMSDREEDVVRAYASGARSYIQKPVDLKLFKTVLKQFEEYWTGVSRLPTSSF
jgi:CheY-like chemotaxis protein